MMIIVPMEPKINWSQRELLHVLAATERSSWTILCRTHSHMWEGMDGKPSAVPVVAEFDITQITCYECKALVALLSKTTEKSDE